jgi:hypothetical protein
VFFLSGDIHSAEFNQDQCAQYYLGYNANELTSSGLTHAVKEPTVPWSYLDNTADYLTRGIREWFWPDYTNNYLDRYHENNFGEIKFDEFKITATIYNKQGKIAKNVHNEELSREFKVTDLEYTQNYATIDDADVAYEKCIKEREQGKEVRILLGTE